MLTRLSTSGRAGRYWEGLVPKQRTGHNLFLNFTERKNMRKLISILVATVFAVSSGAALAASHAGAQPMKDDKKSEMKRSEEHTSELQSRQYLVCRLLLAKKEYTTDVSDSTHTTLQTLCVSVI